MLADPLLDIHHIERGEAGVGGSKSGEEESRGKQIVDQCQNPADRDSCLPIITLLPIAATAHAAASLPWMT